MKVLIANNYYFPNMEGGAEFSVKLLAESLVESGCDVYVLSMDGKTNTSFESVEIINGVKVIRCFSKSIYRRRILKDKTHFKDNILNGIHSIWNHAMNENVRKIVDEISPDIIHSNNLVSMSYWIWKYAKKRNIPVVHTLRDYWLLDPTTNIGNTPEVLVYFFRLYNRQLSNKYVSLVTAPSDCTLEIFKEKGYFVNCKKQKIVNAISFDYNLMCEMLEEKLCRNNQKVNFVFAGKVSENKGIKILINSFIKSGVEGNLTICGSGDLETWIKEKNNVQIILKGKLQQEELFEEYRKADVLIVPSLWEEPFGRIVIEGAQYGLPIIGSDRGGIPEIIRELNFGEIFDVTDFEQLLLLIRKFSNREYLRTFLLRGPKNLDQYSVSTQTKHFIEIYKQCVDRNV